MEGDHVTTFHLCARRFVYVQRWVLDDQQQHAVNSAWCGLLLNTHRVMCIIVHYPAFKPTFASGSNLHGGT